MTVYPLQTKSDSAVVCQSDLPYLWRGQSLTTSGIYKTKALSAFSCDTIVTLNLTVNQPSASSEDVTVCTSDLLYLWNGEFYTVAGSYTYTTLNAVGCDSVVTLNLVVNQPSASTEDMTVCTSDLPYLWNGESYTTEGSYNYTTLNAVGCDSVVTLCLAVNTSYLVADTINLFLDDFPYMWNGIEITEAGEYIFNGTTVEGCDSVVKLILTLTTDLEFAEENWFVVAPNSIEKGETIAVELSDSAVGLEDAEINLYSPNGQLFSRFGVTENICYIKMPEVAGLYVLQLITKFGPVKYEKIVVK